MSEVKSFGKILAEKLKAKGLDLAEEVAGTVVEAVFETGEEVVLLTPNKYDDLLLPVLKLAKPELMKLVDKIDGEEG